jgi:hypothetical protein
MDPRATMWIGILAMLGSHSAPWARAVPPEGPARCEPVLVLDPEGFLEASDEFVRQSWEEALRVTDRWSVEGYREGLSGEHGVIWSPYSCEAVGMRVEPGEAVSTERCTPWGTSNGRVTREFFERFRGNRLRANLPCAFSSQDYVEVLVAESHAYRLADGQVAQAMTLGLLLHQWSGPGAGEERIAYAFTLGRGVPYFAQILHFTYSGMPGADRVTRVNRVEAR